MRRRSDGQVRPLCVLGLGVWFDVEVLVVRREFRAHAGPERPAWSGMSALRPYLAVATILVIVKIIELAAGH